jgi:hypothetical protein
LTIKKGRVGMESIFEYSVYSSDDNEFDCNTLIFVEDMVTRKLIDVGIDCTISNTIQEADEIIFETDVDLHSEIVHIMKGGVLYKILTGYDYLRKIFEGHNMIFFGFHP